MAKPSIAAYYLYHSCYMEPKPSLERFILAQETQYPLALAEIAQGQKRSHWMWYIFPQIAGLGWSDTSKFYAIRDLDEAQAYLQHPLLGPRLVQITQTLLRSAGKDAYRIFGHPDDKKLQSMTLFAALPRTDPVFQYALDKFFDSLPDPATLRLISS